MNKKVQALLLPLAQRVEAFGEQMDALDTYVSQAKKAVIFTWETRLSKVEVVYVTKASTCCPISTLFARVYPIKTRPLVYHLHELAPEGDFRCTYFPMIGSEQQLDAAFSVLTERIQEYMPSAEALAGDAEAYERAWNDKQQLLLTASGQSEKDVPADPEQAAVFWETWTEFYETFCQLARFTNCAPYRAFVKGDTAKAVKIYTKWNAKGNLFPYEQRLLAFMCTPQGAAYAPLSEECASLYQSFDHLENQDGATFFACAGLLYALFLLLGVLITGAVSLFAGADTVYHPVDWVIACMMPLMPAVFGAVSLRRWFITHVFRKNAAYQLSLDALVNGKVLNVLAHGLFGLSAVAVVWLTLVFALATPRFYADRMVYDDAARFPLLHPVVYAYEDVERIHYIAGRYNAYEDFIDRPSYVLVFRDGTLIDLDAVITEAQTKDHVLPLLAAYDIPIEEQASDRELIDLYGERAEQLFTW